jgi:hypothetical protein
MTPFCNYICVGDFVSGCACASYNFARNSVQTGSYTISAGLLTTTNGTFQGGPGSPPQHVAGAKTYCRQGNVLQFGDAQRAYVVVER